jgi:hypothetical protein
MLMTKEEKVPVSPLSQSVVVVDTFSTGAWLSCILYNKGYNVIQVQSIELDELLAMVPDGLEFSFVGSCKLKGNLEKSQALQGLIEDIRSVGIPVSAVLAGAEPGVELADALSEGMGLRTNGTASTEVRRNKFAMGEAVRSAGLRAVKQLKSSTWGEIEAWIDQWRPSPFKVIVKPVDSAGSEDVTLCLSIEDVQRAFGNILGKVNGLGIVNEGVLVQEFLEGEEFESCCDQMVIALVCQARSM